jgi:hypothetical protein
MAVGIHLQYDGAAGRLLSHFFHFGRRHATGPAPLRPEVHEDWHLRLAYHFVELVAIDLKGTVDGANVGLALPAAEVRRQIGWFDAIFFAALLARENHHFTLGCELESTPMARCAN